MCISAQKSLKGTFNLQKWKFFQQEMKALYISKAFLVHDLQQQPGGLPVLLNSCQSGERLSVYNGSCGWIFYTVLPGNPTLQRVAEQQEGGERKFSLVPWRREKMNEGGRKSARTGVITRWCGSSCRRTTFDFTHLSSLFLKISPALILEEKISLKQAKADNLWE